MDSTLASVQLIGIMLEIAVYGIYATLVPRAYSVLQKKDPGLLLIKYLRCFLIAKFLLTTLHVILGVGQVIYAFTTHTDQAGFAVIYLSRLNTVIVLLRTTCHSMVFALSDILIVLRTYILWERSLRVVALPALLFVVELGHHAMFMVRILTDNIDLARRNLIIVTVISWSLNLSSSGFLVYKIWKSRCISTRSYFNTSIEHLSIAIIIVIECALVYSLIALALLIATALFSVAAVILILELAVPLTGITFIYVTISSSNFQANAAIQQGPATSNALGSNRNDRLGSAN
ncbi:hypothetical protein QCA50_014619 [Cerrena zonata]|uniref:G protein-coupled receptor n=1 Tax=Cerrena zonata TaxID=2478898 RepID=A0AAW0FTQ9_9APHY